MNRWAAVPTVLLLTLAPLLVGCSERRLDESLTDNPTTTVPGATSLGAAGDTAPGATAAAASPTARVVARLGTIRTSDLKLGAAFNSQFLSLQFYAVGLDATEARCATTQIMQKAGDEFGRRAVSQIMSGAGITPDVLTPCLSTDRLMGLAKSGARPDLSRAPADVLRSTFTELASAGYESAGLTPVESTCLADRVVGAYPDQQLAGLTTSLNLASSGIEPALTDCLTTERMTELGG